MREKFLKYIKELESSKDLVIMYQDLAEIFSKATMYQRQAGCLEKIWNITQKHELLLEIGNIFLNKLNQSEIAILAYNRYFQFTQPEFYKQYMTTLNNLGYSNFNPSLDNNDYSRELIRLCDNFDTVFYMMLYLHKMKDYDSIMELESYLIKYRSKVQQFLIKHPKEEMEMLIEIENNAKELSNVLSQTKDREDINKLAIILNPQNRDAYINIFDILSTSNKLQKALDLYNNVYAKTFNLDKAENISDVYWHLSHYYNKIYDFYKSVFYQKKALEIEVGE